MSVQPWKRVEPTTKFSHGYRDVIIKTFIQPGTNDAVPFTTFIDEDTSYAGVVALTKDHKVIVARQFRQGPERIMDELPGGGVDPGEEPEAAARRELQEETGYRAGTMELLGSGTHDGYMNGTWCYYFATDCQPSPSGTNPDEHEQIEVVLMSIDEFLQSAKQGNLTDPLAVLMAYDRLQALKQL